MYTHTRTHTQRNRYGPPRRRLRGDRESPEHHVFRTTVFGCVTDTHGPPRRGLCPTRGSGLRAVEGPAATAGTGRSSLALAGPAGARSSSAGHRALVLARRWRRGSGPQPRRETSGALLVDTPHTAGHCTGRAAVGQGARETPSFGLRTRTPDAGNFYLRYRGVVL